MTSSEISNARRIDCTPPEEFKEMEDIDSDYDGVMEKVEFLTRH